MRLTLIAHSTVMIELDEGINLITDPWFESFHFLRTEEPSIGADGIHRCELMLISHSHIDHIDRAGLNVAKRLGSRIICSKRVAEKAKKAGLNDVFVMMEGGVYNFRGIEIYGVKADHPFASDSIGFVIKGKRVLYFSGDTRYSDHLACEISNYNVEIAMVQIACSWYPFIGKDGMDINGAKRLIERVKPEIAIPIHYQVKTKSPDPEVFKRIMQPIRVEILKPGRPLII